MGRNAVDMYIECDACLGFKRRKSTSEAAPTLLGEALGEKKGAG